MWLAFVREHLNGRERLCDTKQHISILFNLRWKSRCFICSPTLGQREMEKKRAQDWGGTGGLW